MAESSPPVSGTTSRRTPQAYRRRSCMPSRETVPAGDAVRPWAHAAQFHTLRSWTYGVSAESQAPGRLAVRLACLRYWFSDTKTGNGTNTEFQSAPQDEKRS